MDFSLRWQNHYYTMFLEIYLPLVQRTCIMIDSMNSMHGFAACKQSVARTMWRAFVVQCDALCSAILCSSHVSQRERERGGEIEEYPLLHHQQQCSTANATARCTRADSENSIYSWKLIYLLSRVCSMHARRRRLSFGFRSVPTKTGAHFHVYGFARNTHVLSHSLGCSCAFIIIIYSMFLINKIARSNVLHHIRPALSFMSSRLTSIDVVIVLSMATHSLFGFVLFSSMGCLCLPPSLVISIFSSLSHIIIRNNFSSAHFLPWIFIK